MGKLFFTCMLAAILCALPVGSDSGNWDSKPRFENLEAEIAKLKAERVSLKAEIDQLRETVNSHLRWHKKVEQSEKRKRQQLEK